MRTREDAGVPGASGRVWTAWRVALGGLWLAVRALAARAGLTLALIALTAGRVWVDGQDLTRLPEAALTTFRRRRVGFVVQVPARDLLPYASAAQNLELPMRLAGVPAARRASAAARCSRPPASTPWAAGRSGRCLVASSSGSPSPSHACWSFCGPAGPDRHHNHHGDP